MLVVWNMHTIHCPCRTYTLHTANGEHTYYTVCREHTPYDLTVGTTYTHCGLWGNVDYTLHTGNLYTTHYTLRGTHVHYCRPLMHLLSHSEDSSETSVQLSQTTSCHIPEDSTLPHVVFFLPLIMQESDSTSVCSCLHSVLLGSCRTYKQFIAYEINKQW
jgi:hypothetical protein